MNNFNVKQNKTQDEMYILNRSIVRDIFSNKHDEYVY